MLDLETIWNEWLRKGYTIEISYNGNYYKLTIESRGNGFWASGLIEKMYMPLSDENPPVECLIDGDMICPISIPDIFLTECKFHNKVILYPNPFTTIRHYPRPYCEEISICKIPHGIDINGIPIEPNKCLSNSYAVSLKYPSVLMVEGVILLKTSPTEGKVISHAWNSIDGQHFDVT